MAVQEINRKAKARGRQTRELREYREIYQVLCDAPTHRLADIKEAFYSLHPFAEPYEDDETAVLIDVDVEQSSESMDVFDLTAIYRWEQGRSNPNEDTEIPPWLRAPVRSVNTVFREYPTSVGFWPLGPVAAVLGVNPPDVNEEIITPPRNLAGDFLADDLNLYGYINEIYYGRTEAGTYTPNGGTIPYFANVNTAGFPVDPPVMRQVPHKQITFTKNVQFYDENTLSKIVSTINPIALGPYPAGTVMLGPISSQELWEGEWHYYQLKLTFDHNPFGWNALFLNAGYTEKVLNPLFDPTSSYYDPAKSPGTDGPKYIYRRIDSPDPWPLDANGKKLSDPGSLEPFDTNAILVIERRIYRFYDHNRLGFRFG